MNDETNRVLTQAYELIEADRLDEAKARLEPILESQKDNPDVWWVYAHAVSDAEVARQALQNVLRLDPDYPDARPLLNTLEETHPAPSATIARIAPRPSVEAPAAPPTLPDLSEGRFAETGATAVQEKPRSPLSTRRLAILAPILIVVIIAGLLLLLNSTGPGQVTTTPTEVSQQPLSVPTLSVTEITPLDVPTLVAEEPTATAVPLAEQTVLPTEIPETSPTAVQPEGTGVPSGTGNSFDAIYDALGNFIVPRNGVTVIQTSLGNTLLAAICTNPGPELRNALPQAMDIMANASSSLAADIQAVGVRMMNCGSSTTLLQISVPIEDAAAYAAGQLDEATFESRWKSQ